MNTSFTLNTIAKKLGLVDFHLEYTPFCLEQIFNKIDSDYNFWPVWDTFTYLEGHRDSCFPFPDLLYTL